MTKCARSECYEKATHAPRIIIPAKGWPEAWHDPLKMFVNLECCEAHAEEIDFATVERMEPRLKDMIRGAAQKQRRAPPDFDRARVSVVSIRDPQYREFRQLSERTTNDNRRPQ